MCGGLHSALVLLACQPGTETDVVGVGPLLRRLLALHLSHLFRLAPTQWRRTFRLGM